MPTVAGITVETGCWIDGHHGQYANDRLASIADSYFDWHPAESTDDPRKLRERAEWWDRWAPNDQHNYWDMAHDAADVILDWLNDRTDDDHIWMWQDGELFLWERADIDQLIY